MYSNVLKVQQSHTVAFADFVRTRERDGSKVIKMQTGDPDFATHPKVVLAAHQALLDSHTKYCDSRGLLSLRSALAIKLSENNKIYAAGLDVFNNEPKLDERYLKLNNCFTLPHVGSADNETRTAMSMMAVKNIEAHFNKSPYLSRVV